jgi:cobalt/nickel transport system permease protein
MWAAASALTSYSAGKIRKELDDKKVPLMGVLGAFIFATQMINFTIPGTGSSGHLGGGMILAILLGPYAGFLTMASILTVQALFFADGGLLALGANIFNLGFFPCFIAYPLIYKRIVGDTPTSGRLFFGISLASIMGLQLGALGVVTETLLSGITELSFTSFTLLMQPIHLAIGVVEGLITTAVILFVWKERPEILEKSPHIAPLRVVSMKGVVVPLLIAAVFISGVLSWFASANPDGLEWAIMKATGQEELEAPEGLHSLLADLQQKIAFFPDYNLKEAEPAAKSEAPQEEPAAWPAIDPGTSVAGLAGSLLTLLLAGVIGKGLRLAVKRN